MTTSMSCLRAFYFLWLYTNRKKKHNYLTIEIDDFCVSRGRQSIDGWNVTWTWLQFGGSVGLLERKFWGRLIFEISRSSGQTIVSVADRLSALSETRAWTSHTNSLDGLVCHKDLTGYGLSSASTPPPHPTTTLDSVSTPTIARSTIKRLYLIRTERQLNILLPRGS